MNDLKAEVFIAIVDLNEAKNHQIKLKSQNIDLFLKTHPSTCTSGCKVTVEMWADAKDIKLVKKYFENEYLKHLKGHLPDFNHLSEVYDSSKEEVICQACGTRFSSKLKTCPDCGLVYF